MRSDMAKLLIDAPRYKGHTDRSRKWGKRLKYNPDSDYEDEVNFVSSSRKRHGNSKSLGDYLTPMRRFLKKNVGRHWDDVYSEICQHIDCRTLDRYHFFQHVWQYVERDCWMGINGLIYTYGYGGPSRVHGFYVHPYTGVLSEQRGINWWQEEAAKKPPTPITHYRITDIAHYERIEGIWYYIENYTVEHEGVTEIPPYSWERKLIPNTEPQLYRVTWTERIHTCRQLNKKGLRQAGLENEIKEPRPLSRRQRRALKIM